MRFNPRDVWTAAKKRSSRRNVSCVSESCVNDKPHPKECPVGESVPTVWKKIRWFTMEDVAKDFPSIRRKIVQESKKQVKSIWQLALVISLICHHDKQPSDMAGFMSAINRFRGPRNLKKIKVISIEWLMVHQFCFHHWGEEWYFLCATSWLDYLCDWCSLCVDWHLRYVGPWNATDVECCEE